LKDMSFFTKIFLARDAVDFRKQAHSLALMVTHVLEQNPIQDRVLFVFTNRRRNAVKILYWDQTGYALWWKGLEREKFRWPKITTEGSKMLVSVREVKWLLEGVDIAKIKKHEKIAFS
jgi:transposase